MPNAPKPPFQAIIERRWQWVRNEIVLAAGSSTATMKALALRIKTTWMALPASPPVVLGSSDATTAGMDGVDRVTDVSDIVCAAGAHSWVVYQVGAQQLCWDWNTSDASEATLVVSLAGFTGGTTTARPTASDERVLVDADDWNCGGDVRQVLQILHSTDGTQSMVMCFRGGDAKTFILLGTALEPVVGWTTPYMAFAGAQGNDSAGLHATEWERLFRTPGMKSWGPGGAMDLFASSFVEYPESAGFKPACVQADVPDPLTGLYPPQPMALVSVTPGMSGRHGRLPDLWFVAPSLANGLYPNRTDIAKFGDYLMPWETGAVAPVMT